MALTQKTIGILLGLAAFAAWATGDTISKIVTTSGVEAWQALTVVCIYNVIFIIGKKALQNNMRALWPKQARWVFLRGFAGVLNSFFTIYAFKNLPMTDAYVLLFMGPFCIAIGAAVFMKERLTLPMLVVIAVGFMGAMIAINPPALFSNGGSLIGYGAAVVAMVFYTIQQLLTRHLSDKEDHEAVFLWPNIIGVIIGCFFSSSLLNLPSGAYLFLVGMSICGMSGAYLIIAALERSQSAMIAPLQYTQLIPGAIIGYLIWGYVPHISLWIGAVFIVASGVALVQLSKRPIA